MEGKGRGDLDLSILTRAEDLLEKNCSESQWDDWTQVHLLARQVRQVFCDVRFVVRGQAQNLEMVHPHLGNNFDLVELIERFEAVWEKAKSQLSADRDVRNIVQFTRFINNIKARSKKFEVDLETMESTVFFTIPAVLILRSLDAKDSGLCAAQFAGSEKVNHCKTLWNDLRAKWASNSHKTISAAVLENVLLDNEEESILKDINVDILGDIKNLSI